MASAQRPFEVAELDHVVLRCAAQAKALEFYTQVLGLTEERRLPEMGLIQLRAGNSMVDLVPAAQPTSPTAHNLEHFCLGVRAPDFDRMVEHLRASGVEIVGEPAPRYGARGTGPSVYIRDPEGNVVELKQMPIER